MSNFEVCASQNDDWVGTVRIRLSDHRASSDPSSTPLQEAK